MHVLDLMENSVRAGATSIAVELEEYPEKDLLVLSVEDDGSGMPSGDIDVTDPFFSTKGKKTGLGLSLMRAAAEAAGGKLDTGRSRLGGALVRASMSMGHVDRSPLGDLAASLSAVACSHPDVELSCRIRTARGTEIITTRDFARGLAGVHMGALAVARDLSARVRRAMHSLAVDD